MKRRLSIALLGAGMAGVLSVGAAWGAPPWANLVPFKKVEADPNKNYTLLESHGPWLVMCRSFAGDTAEQDAQALLLELRQKFKLKAYMHRQHYDFTKTEIGRGLDPDGRPKRMKAANATTFDEIAVLVGDFDSVDDPKLADALESIKQARPKCLEIKAGNGQSARYWGMRPAGRNQTGERDNRGPMRMAFVTRNPMLPAEYFAPKGLDPLVVDMNRDVEHSLLKNPQPFSVRVVSFQGDSTMTLDEIKAREKASTMKRSKLQEGAEKAHKICVALRKQGIEAYEFHDLHESMVTVGGFEWVSEKRPDGRDEINPAVHAVMEHFKAKQVKLPGTGATGMSPMKVANISLDIQPIPVAVPRQSIGRAMSKRSRD